MNPQQISSPADLQPAVKAYLAQETKQSKSSLLEKISAFLKKSLRQARRKGLEEDPTTVIVGLEFLLATLYSQSEEFYKSQAPLDLLPYLFQLATYKDQRLFIPAIEGPYERDFASALYFKQDVQPLKQVDLADLSKEKLQARANALADRLVALTILKVKKAKDVLWALTDLMMKKVKSSKQVARMVVCFSTLYSRLTKKFTPFFSGSLYVLGGYIKNEAKSYLKSQEPSTPIEQGENVREINDDDRLFFQDGGLVRSLQILLSNTAKPLKGTLSLNSFETYRTILTEEEIPDEIDAKVSDRLQAAHCVLLALFDITQYYFAYDISGKVSEGTEVPQINWEFRLPGSETFAETVLNGVSGIVSDPLLLYECWHEWGEDKQDKNEVQKNSYERQDHYNYLGCAAYFCLLHTRRGLPGMWSPDFLFRLLLPPVAALITTELPVPGFRLLGIESLGLLLRPYLGDDTHNLAVQDISLAENVFRVILEKSGAGELGDSEQSKRSIAILWKSALKKIVAKDALQIYEGVLAKLDNDPAAGFLLDCLRMDGRLTDPESVRKILDFALYLRKDNLLEELERVSAAVQLLQFILLKEKSAQIEIIEKEYKKTLKEDYLSPIKERLEVMMANRDPTQPDAANLASRVQLLQSNLEAIGGSLKVSMAW